MADQRFLLDRLRRRRSCRGTVFIAFDGRTAVGYVYLRLGPAEEPDLRRRLPRTPVLERLRVVEGYRGRGIGRQLVSRVERAARRRLRRWIALGIAEDASEPVGFYERIGYREWGFGQVETFREEHQEGGRSIREVEYCRIFVKNLWVNP